MASNKYQRWKKAELVAECSKRELPIEGTNPVLARRLHRDDERKARRLESGGEPDAVGAQEGMGEEQDVGMGERDAPQGDVQEAWEEEIGLRNPAGDIGSSVVEHKKKKTTGPRRRLAMVAVKRVGHFVSGGDECAGVATWGCIDVESKATSTWRHAEQAATTGLRSLSYPLVVVLYKKIIK
eukprot:TRINITY_DN857_c0_g1_i1.p1 TRINITY_DN857_c0_g1~~TRINITY_DN857_c0_g1_i1.p1  ORF type:complete len:182 (+),score=15.51 TRINITY_DN857_c0_g1_i1:45-590(+)